MERNAIVDIRNYKEYGEEGTQAPHLLAIGLKSSRIEKYFCLCFG